MELFTNFSDYLNEVFKRVDPENLDSLKKIPRKKSFDYIKGVGFDDEGVLRLYVAMEYEGDQCFIMASSDYEVDLYLNPSAKVESEMRRFKSYIGKQVYVQPSTFDWKDDDMDIAVPFPYTIADMEKIESELRVFIQEMQRELNRKDDTMEFTGDTRAFKKTVAKDRAYGGLVDFDPADDLDL